MKKRDKTLILLGGLPLAFAAMAMILGNSLNSNFVFRTRANNSHAVVDVTSTSISLDNNYSVSAVTSGFTDGSLFSLSSAGYIRNVDPIRGITSIEVTYGTGSPWAKIVPCYYDYENDDVVPSVNEWPAASTTADFSSSPIDYFELYNPEESNSITITSITITYSCSTPSYSFSVSFTPNWNDKTAEDHADIYIAGTPELISDGTSSGGWNYKKMTYSAGVYSYNSPNPVTTGIFAYAFYASKNGSAINWSNPSSQGNQTLVLTSNANDTTAYAWDREPGSAQTYKLNVILYETDNGAWATWRGFNYSTSSSSLTTGTWGENLEWVVKTDGVDKYQYNDFEIESASSTVYIALTIGMTDSNTSIDPAYVGETTTKAFTVNYSDGATEATLTINKTFTSVTSAYAADSYTVETNGGETPSGMSHPNVSLGIYDLDANSTSITNGRSLISPTFSSGSDTFTASYSGENIRIDTIDGNQYITALKAGTSTTVTLTSDSDPTVNCSFTVTVPSSTYSATADRDSKWASSEGWFTSSSVSEITGMGSSFYNGVDISSVKALYQNGSNFYNASGVEQSLFYILKDVGVNWIRLKLWVDPYTAGGVSYGGGIGDLSSTLWMAYEAKAAGLNLLLDFHYSDYWTHPSQQILPKAWAGAASASALANYIKTYTTSTLNTFKNNSCLPDMVQLGNEISSGNFLSIGSTSETFGTGDNLGKPSYLMSQSNFGYQGTSGSDNMKTYLNAASDGVDEVDSSIKKVIHWAKGGSISASVINIFFSSLSSVDYDYAAISFYPYYCFDTLSNAQTILNGLSLSKPWFIAEASYPFTSESYVYENGSDVTNFSISGWNRGDTNIYNSYSFTMSGQASLIHDLTAATVSAGGLGIFYWEPAWIPNANVGWAGAGSLNTWGNQGFFSYDGKVTGNINVFKQMSPHI